MDFCPMCYSETAIEDTPYNSHKRIVCPICGEYYFEENFFEDPKVAVCGYIYKAINNNKVIPVFTKNINLPWPLDSNMEIVTPQQLLDLYPKNLTELIDQIVLNIAFYIKTIGSKITNIYLNNVIERQYAKKSALIKTIFCVYDNNIEQVNVLIKHLEKLGYIEPVSVGMFALTLSFKGWMRVEKLQNKASSANQAYLIVSDKENVTACKDVFKKVALALDLTPKFADEALYSKPMISEIFYEIRRSKIVIADLTYQKPHIYYETGYAEALKKPVIYTCKHGYSVKRQLDIIHNNLIKWENPEQLYDLLTTRVSAVLNL
ncbi:MAG TPA: hypothetical protein VIL23_05425 [Clostridia bacterium]